MAKGSARPWRIAVPLALAVAGLLAATSATTARGTDLRAERHTDLTDLIRDRQRQLQAQEGVVTRLREDVDRLTAERGADDARVAVAQRRAATLSGPAGLTALTGPGVIVTLDDAKREPGTELPPDVTADDLVVHQQDVQAVINAMWAADADAVQVMDQRLVATSAVRCVGNTLILHGRVYSPPYRVIGLGDEAAIRRALTASPRLGTYRQWVDTVGLGYRVRARASLTVPAYGGPLGIRLARTAP